MRRKFGGSRDQGMGMGEDEIVEHLSSGSTKRDR